MGSLSDLIALFQLPAVVYGEPVTVVAVKI
jgi:hypothetical protein